MAAKEKQVSDFGTYRDTQVATMVKGVLAHYGITLRVDPYTGENAGFSALRFEGRMGLDRYGQIHAFVKGIDWAHRH